MPEETRPPVVPPSSAAQRKSFSSTRHFLALGVPHAISVARGSESVAFFPSKLETAPVLVERGQLCTGDALTPMEADL